MDTIVKMNPYIAYPTMTPAILMRRIWLFQTKRNVVLKILPTVWYPNTAVHCTERQVYRLPQGVSLNAP